jgi:alcohol dehydrogenase class IV
MDALTQLMESFLSRRANPFSDALCREAIPRAARSLELAFRNGGDRSARTEMTLAALSSGLALANAGLGAVHGIAAPVGGLCSAAHGSVCAALLGPVLQTNLEAARRDARTGLVLERYVELSRLVGASGGDEPQALIDWVVSLTARLRVPRLGEQGVVSNQIEEIARRSLAASSMKGNPVTLSAGAVEATIRAAL